MFRPLRLSTVIVLVGTGAASASISAIPSEPVSDSPRRTLSLSEVSPDRIPLVPFIEVMEDKSRSAKLAEIRGRSAADWKTAKGRLFFGASKSVFWARIRIENKGRELSRRYLVFPAALHDYISYYAVADDRIVDGRVTGDRTVFSTRGNSYRSFAFPVAIDPGAQMDVYLRFDTHDGLFDVMKPTLSTGEALSSRLTNEALKHGIFAGILVCAILYSLFVLGSVRESASLFYVAFVFIMLCSQVVFFGYAFQFFLPNWPHLNNQLLPLSQAASGVALVAFTRTLLQTRTHFKWMDRLILISVFPWVAILILALSGHYRLNYLIFQIAMPPSVLLVLVVGFTRIRQGYRPARFFTLGVGLSMIGTLLFGFSVMGLIPDHPVFLDGSAIGLTLEAVVFSRALASRVRVLREEKDQAQRDIIEQKSNLFAAASRFVPAPFLKFLGKEDITTVQLGDAVQADLSVLFTDIRSFTTISESMTPEENFRFLNQLYGGLAPIIRENKGFVDKFIGDAIMALFPEGPLSAVNAARAVAARLHEFNRTRATEGRPPIRIGIGIHHGSTMLGTLGESARMETTVISDAVNLASRLEALTSKYGVMTLISEDVYTVLDRNSKAGCREIDRVRVKGKTRAVTVYEVMG